MNIIEPILLGVVQGITEWLPVSSEGISSLLMMNFFGKTLSEAVFLSIWLHTGTLLAALVYFRRDIIGIIRNVPVYFKNPRGMKGYNGLTSFLVVSTLLTGALGAPILLLGLDKITFSGGHTMAFIGFLLIVTGLIQRFGKKGGLKKELKIKDALLAGIFQAFSVLPGLSRSGLTTSVLLFEKYEPKNALKLSFLMSIPAVLVAELGLGLLGKISFDLYSGIAIFFSFLFGLVTIGTLMKVAKRVDFSWFCIFLGLVSLLAVFA